MGGESCPPLIQNFFVPSGSSCLLSSSDRSRERDVPACAQSAASSDVVGEAGRVWRMGYDNRDEARCSGAPDSCISEHDLTNRAGEGILFAFAGSATERSNTMETREIAVDRVCSALEG
jgi:hypothetical protein